MPNFGGESNECGKAASRKKRIKVPLTITSHEGGRSEGPDVDVMWFIAPISMVASRQGCGRQIRDLSRHMASMQSYGGLAEVKHRAPPGLEMDWLEMERGLLLRAGLL